MKDDKIMVTGNDLRVSTRAIYFGDREWDSGRRKAWRRLDSASSFAISSDRTFHVLRVRHT